MSYADIYVLIIISHFLQCLRKIAETDYYLRHVCRSVRMEQLGSLWTYFHKIDIWVFFENPSRKFKFHYNVTGRHMKTISLFYTFFVIFPSLVFLEREMFGIKGINKIQTHIVGFFFEILAIYWIMWKNLYSRAGHRWQYGACCIPNATNTHSQYVTLTAFPQQHWLHECVSLLCYTYSAGLVNCCLRQINRKTDTHVAVSHNKCQ